MYKRQILDTQDEKEKFTEVDEQYQHFCWYVANQLLGDAHLAEDAVQDALLALTRHLDLSLIHISGLAVSPEKLLDDLEIFPGINMKNMHKNKITLERSEN